MKPAFVINARNKAPFVGKAVVGALSQSMPCEILLSDQGSTDGTYEAMEMEVMNYQAQHEAPYFHDIKLLKCPIVGPYNMAGCNAHFDWLWKQTQAEWIFQCSADDYSLPDRVKVCMAAVEKNPCDVIATHQFFETPGKGRTGRTGFPEQSQYIEAGPGLVALAYGSCIAGYNRSFLEKVGGAGPNTIDVLYGYLAALGKGFYVVAEPHHVHVDVADLNNAGFGGKLAAATGDEALRLAELNHTQLFRLYKECADRALVLKEGQVPNEAWVPLMNILIGQAAAWLGAREALSAANVMPGAL